MPAVPHPDRPLCEPVELRPGAHLRIERVRQDAAAPTEPFPHFHDVHELVLFGDVAGECVAEGRRWPLATGCIVFVPSLREHDFALAPGPRDWLLVQLDAAAGESLARRPGMERLAHAFCALPDARLHARIAALADWLADWLADLRSDDPLALALAEVLLRAAVGAPQLPGERLPADEDSLERLRPAIERLRRDPAHAPSAEQAAALCALAPAYFSRRFKRQVGMAWSDYVRTHRLHLASQRLRECDESIAAISDALGFSTPSHFGQLFQRRFAMTPAAYRRAGRVQRGSTTPRD